MNFNEVFDFDPKEKQARIMQQLQRQFGPRPAPVQDKAKEERANAFRASRDRAEATLAGFAKQATSIEDFKALADQHVPDWNRYTSLDTVFNAHNTKALSALNKSWDGFDNKPAMPGSNYTGD